MRLTLMLGSIEQGNVSRMVPALHGLIGIRVSDGARNHTRQFNAAAALVSGYRNIECCRCSYYHHLYVIAFVAN